jgi:hypothetical protein
VYAVRYYRKAAKQGDARAKNNLGFCYVKGYGVQKNQLEATKWFLKAAEQGCDVAQYNLGMSYYKGDGVEKNAVEAYAYFKLAGITYKKAQKRGDLLKKEMTKEQLQAAQRRAKELQASIKQHAANKK